jgi:phospholipase C
MPENPSPIQHVVVLMLENRSFDHMLGHLKYTDPGSSVNGLTGTESNPIPTPPGGTETVGWNAEYLTKFDVGHEYDEVVLQMFGSETVPSPPAALNNGFVHSLVKREEDADIGRTAMHCFTEERLPALYALAREFAVCDNWFCSMPGPTWPNRFFVHAASSKGFAANRYFAWNNQEVIFDHLSEAGVDWRIYYSDVPQSLALKRLTWPTKLKRFRRIGNFPKDVAAGNLPGYTFIEPRYFNRRQWKANDQHPKHDVRLGDYLIAEVYEALRGSPLWESTLLVVVYDEHGGLYDHVPPPYDGMVIDGKRITVTAPGGKVSIRPRFGFDRLGPRVPALLISPWIARGTVDHTVYEHSSIPATLRKMFGVKKFLNERQREVNTFDSIFTPNLRKDTPAHLPRAEEDARIAHLGARVLEDADAETMDAVWRRDPDALEFADEQDLQPISDFQQELLELAYSLDHRPVRGLVSRLTAPVRARAPRTEIDASVEAQVRVEAFLNQAPVPRRPSPPPSAKGKEQKAGPIEAA